MKERRNCKTFFRSSPGLMNHLFFSDVDIFRRQIVAAEKLLSPRKWENGTDPIFALLDLSLSFPP